jgi:uncharacterized protein YcgL (UPF0745 family)
MNSLLTSTKKLETKPVNKKSPDLSSQGFFLMCFTLI